MAKFWAGGSDESGSSGGTVVRRGWGPETGPSEEMVRYREDGREDGYGGSGYGSSGYGGSAYGSSAYGSRSGDGSVYSENSSRMIEAGYGGYGGHGGSRAGYEEEFIPTIRGGRNGAYSDSFLQVPAPAKGRNRRANARTVAF